MVPPRQLPPPDLPPDRALAHPYYADYTTAEVQPAAPRGSILEYWRILRRRKRTLLLFAAAGVAASVLFTLPQTPIYQARAAIEIQGMNDDFLHLRDLNPTSSNTSYDPGWDMQTQVRILQTNALVSRVVNKVIVDSKPFVQTPSRLAKWFPKLGPGQSKAGGGRESAVRAAAESLHVRAIANSRLIEILCESPSAAMAAEFANTLAGEFIEQNLEARWQTTQHTGAWLARQMEDVKTKLEHSEETLGTYARETGLVFTQERDNVAEQRLKQLQDELSKAQAERIARQSRFELASRASAETIGEVLDDGTLKELRGKVTDLRRQLAELTSSFTAAHPRVKKVEAQIATLEGSLLRARENILTRIRNDFEAAERREKLLAADYSASVKALSAQTDQVAHYNNLKREVDTNRQLYESMLQRVKEAGIASALRASNVRVVDPAVAPDAPYKPSYSDNSVLGLLGGLMVGMGYVVLRVRGDRTIQQPGEVGQYIGVRELGIVHSGSVERASSHSTELVTLRARPSLMAESLRATVASILFAGRDGKAPQVLVISSAGPREGKTTLATNLAVGLAEIHKRVLLIDADMRRPRLHRIFEFENEGGLVDVLRLPDVIESVPNARQTGIPNLSLITSGIAGERDPALLHSVRLGELVEQARTEYDMVLIDTPPMLTMADARVVARHADGVVLVARANQTQREALKEASDRLAEDGTAVIGTVLNDWNAKSSDRYRYY